MDAYVARTGVQEYRDGAGNVRREYRPAAAVFDQASLQSFHLKPVTLGHPTEGLLSADNAKRYQVGSIGETVKPERKFVRAKFLVTDGHAIAAIKQGIRELSVGYQATFDEQPGVTDDGQRYDGIQGNIRVNHLAVVESGRAGEDVSIKLDGAAAVARFDAADLDDRKGNKMANVILDGISYEAAPEVVNALAKAQTEGQQLKARFDAASEKAKADLDHVTGERDSLKARVDELEKRDLNAEVAKGIKARLAIVDVARRVLPKETKIDEMTDAEIRKAVIVARFPEAKLDDKSEAYIDARFDAVVESLGDQDRRDNAINRQREVATPRMDGTPVSMLDEADKRAEERIRNAWKAKAA